MQYLKFVKLKTCYCFHYTKEENWAG